VQTAIRNDETPVTPPEARRRLPPWLLPGAVGLVGLTNLVVLAAQAPALVRSLYLNADNASALVLPALASHAPAGSVVNLGNHAWYEPWWFMRASVGLADYRRLWEAAPFVFVLLGFAVVSLCAWWALGRLAGLLCAVALVAASETLREILYIPESHGAIVLHVGVLCAALLGVYRSARADRLGPAVLLGVGVPLVIFTGAGLTDQLLLIGGLGPFVLAPLVCWWRFRSAAWRSVSAFALVTGGLSGLLGLLLTHIMQDNGVVHAPFPIDFVSSEAILVNLGNLLATVAGLGGGGFFGAPASGSNLLTFIAGALTLLAFAAVGRALWRWSRPYRRRETGTSAEPRSSQAGLRELFVAYWGLTLVLVVAVFALTSVSGATNNGRYLIAAWVAVAALLGILATSPPARTALLLAVGLFGLLNVHAELATGVTPAGVGPNQRMAGEIEHYALAHGASVGYSGYWDAAPVTWETSLRVKVRPVAACNVPAGLCPYFNNNISTWYAARPGIRSFLLTDSRPNIPGAIGGPPASLGSALSHTELGEGFSIYVYDHDIAGNLGSE